MAKDPAFLFYPGDWLGGTMTFTRPHKGAYMDLLMAQFSQRRLSIEDIQIILGNDFETMWESKLKPKFLCENGLYYNQKLDSEIERRRNFTNSRKDNLSGKGAKIPHMDNHMDSHMETGNETETINKKLEYFEMIFHQTLPVQHLASWRIWVEHCAEQGHPLKRMEATAQLKKLKDVSLEVDIGEVIKQTIESRHKGFKYIIEQLKDKKHGTGKKSDGAKPEELARIFTDYIVETGQG